MRLVLMLLESPFSFIFSSGSTSNFIGILLFYKELLIILISYTDLEMGISYVPVIWEGKIILWSEKKLH